MIEASDPGRVLFYGAPRLPRHLLARPRLLALLEAAGALTVVRGPAGSGKTVLLAEWVQVRSASAPGVWVTVDGSASSRGGLWRTVLQAVLDAGIADDEVRLVDAISALENPHQLRRELLRAFTHLTEGLTLVLDSFELVTDIRVHEDLAWILRNCAGLQVALATRTLGSLENSVDSVHLDPTFIAPDELMLTVEETAQILALSSIESERDLAATVHNATAGNPLATRAAVISLRKDPSGLSPFLSKRRLRESLEDFLHQMMSDGGLPPRLFDFAIRTAVAEVLTVELARELSGLSDADTMLNDAEAHGLGMWSRGVHGRNFSYTPAVRAVLVAEVRERFPAERAHLWRAAAQWSAHHGRWMDALSLAVDIGDFALASRMVHEPWFELAARHNARVIDVLGPIPRRKLRAHPLLLMMLALCYNADGSHRLRALETFALAITSIRLSRPTDAAEKILLTAAESAALRVSGHIDRALPVAEKGMQALDRLGAEDRDQLGINIGLVLNQIGLTFFYSGRSGEALRAFSSAYTHGGGGRDRSKFHSIALLSGMHAVNGDMTEAKRFVDEAATLHWPDAWKNGYIGSMLHLAKAFLCLERFDFESAQAHVTVMEPHLDTLEHWPLFAHVQAMIDLGQGRAVAGETTLAAALTRGGRSSVTRFTRVRIDASHAMLLLASGNPGAVAKLLRRHPADELALAVIRARFELLTGHSEQAIQMLNHLATNQEISVRTRVEALLVRAAAALELGNSTAAMTNLNQMASLMRDRGLRFPLMLVPRTNLEALRETASAQADSLAHELLADLSTVPEVMLQTLPRMHLSDREIVVLRQLVHTGNIVELSAALFVSPNTVKSQMRSIYRKLGVNSRDEALLIAVDHGLLSD